MDLPAVCLEAGELHVIAGARCVLGVALPRLSGFILTPRGGWGHFLLRTLPSDHPINQVPKSCPLPIPFPLAPRQPHVSSR